MRLTPIEQDRLTLFLAAELGRRRLARNQRLSHPEAVAIIADAMHEAARDGAPYDAVVQAGADAVRSDQVMEGVASLIPFVRVECLFDDGMRLVVVQSPIRPSSASDRETLVPGERMLSADSIPLETRPDSISVDVTNESNDVIWIGSHFPFFEVNKRLSFSRRSAFGRRLDLPAGDAVRFGPHETTTVSLVPFGGERVIVGFNGFTEGPASSDRLQEALNRLSAAGVADEDADA